VAMDFVVLATVLRRFGRRSCVGWGGGLASVLAAVLRRLGWRPCFCFGDRLGWFGVVARRDIGAQVTSLVGVVLEARPGVR